MTGTEFSVRFDEKIGQDFNAYAGGNLSKLDLFKEALYKAIEVEYRNWDEQFESDYLRGLIARDGDCTVSVAGIGIATLPLSYHHLLSLKLSYLAEFINNTCIVVDYNASPLRIKFTKPVNLRNNESIWMQSPTATGYPTAASAPVIFVRQINNYECLLYSDRTLSTPITAINSPTGTGLETQDTSFKAWRHFYARPAKPVRNDSQGAHFGMKSIWSPRYNTYDATRIYFFPNPNPANITSVRDNVWWLGGKGDYLKTPPTLIDPVGVVDLEPIYPYLFLIRVMDEASRIFGGDKRDTELVQLKTVETQIYP